MYTEGKKIVGDALATIKNVNISSSRNQDMKLLPYIKFSEVLNVKACAGVEYRTRLAYSIDIYSETSCTILADEVDAKMVALGFSRGTCTDLDDPSGLRHKNMKYSGVYDSFTNMIYEK